MTPKTVEVHLSNAYRKLGIRSRRELEGARLERVPYPSRGLTPQTLGVRFGVFLDGRAPAALHAGSCMEDRDLTITLELHVAGDSLTGRAVNGAGPERKFFGRLGLLSAIECSSPTPKPDIKEDVWPPSTRSAAPPTPP